MRKDKNGNLSKIYKTNKDKAEKSAFNSLKDIPNSRLISVYVGDYDCYMAKYEIEGNEYNSRVSSLKKCNFINSGLLKGSFLYAFYSDSELLYIGKSSSLNMRLSGHFCEGKGREKWKDDVTDIKIANGEINDKVKIIDFEQLEYKILTKDKINELNVTFTEEDGKRSSPDKRTSTPRTSTPRTSTPRTSTPPK